jgi:hypothetical protein
MRADIGADIGVDGTALVVAVIGMAGVGGVAGAGFAAPALIAGAVRSAAASGLTGKQ